MISERSEESSDDLLSRPPSENSQNQSDNKGEAGPSNKTGEQKVQADQKKAGQNSQKADQVQTPPPASQSENIELTESNMQIVRKHVRDVDKAAGYIRLGGKPDVVLQIQDGYTTIKKKKPVAILEPL